MTLQQMRYVIAIAETGSFNETAKQLYLTQPSLSGAVKELENELGIEIFSRNNKGVSLTEEGKEFLGYARSVINQVELMEGHYSEGARKKHFGVSTQHYTFAVKAFVEMVKGFDMHLYEFAIRETRTMDLIQDVATGRSELGILYLNDFNQKVLEKIFKDKDLQFVEMFSCKGYVYLWRGHPLAGNATISMEDLEEYPCLSFEQGDNASLYLAEEILSTREYKKVIKACDRATLLNLMVGLDAYTLCSGIVCEELNGDDYLAIPLEEDVDMHIGYVIRKHTKLSQIGELYVQSVKDYINNNTNVRCD